MALRSKKAKLPRAAPSRVDSTAALRKLHRVMLGAIREPLTASFDMRRKSRDGGAMKRIAEGFIKPNDRLTSGERLEIYNKQYWFRLLDCLIDDFPGLAAIMGNKAFHALSVAYLNECPSQRFTLRDLGKRLPEFVRSHPELFARRHGLACDVARFEWAQVVAFDEAEFPAVTIDDLLGENPATVRLKLQPHVQLLALGFPIDEMLLAIKKERSAGAVEAGTRKARGPAKGVAGFIPRPSLTFLAVHRHQFDIYYKRLDPAAYAIVHALSKGATLEKACARGAKVAANQPDFAASLPGWFREWAHLGWFFRHV